MKLTAVVLVARAEARRHLGSLALLFVLVVLVGSVVLAAAAGARRSATALDRYMEATNQQDVGGFALGLSAADAPAVLGAVPGVTQVSSADSFLVQPTTPGVSFNFEIKASPDPGFGVAMSRFRVQQGRLPAEDRADEVALNVPAARALGLGEGDTLTVETVSPDSFQRTVAGEGGLVLDGPTLDLRVVGIIQVGEDLQGSTQQSGPIATASPAFWQAYNGVVAVGGSELGMTISDPTAIDAIRSTLSAYPQYKVVTVGEFWADTTRSAINVEVTALLVFAGIALAAGALAVGQATTRQVSADPTTPLVARAMGLTRHERALAATLPALAIGAVGLVVAIGFAVAASGLFPLAIARDAEVSPGIRVDPFVLLIGSGALVLAFATWTFATGLRRDQRIVSPPPERAGRPIGALTGIGTRIAPRLGVRMALDRGRSRATLPTRSTLVGLSAGVAGMVAAIVFLASLDTTLTTPRDFGWTWSARPDFSGDGDPEAMLRQLGSENDVTAVGAVFQADDTQILGMTVPTQAFVAVKGSLEPPVVDGRLPTTADEIALGASTLHDLDLGIGDRVAVGPPGGETTEFSIVGEAVGNQVTGLPDIGVFAVITPDAAMQMTGAETTSQLDAAGFYGNVLITYRPGTDRAVVESRLNETYQLDFRAYSYPKAPGRLLNIDAMGHLVLGLLGFSAFLAAVALTHALMVSTSRRRHEFGVLSTLGLTRRQLRSTVWVQGLTLTAIGLLVGVPIGVVLGRTAWRAAIADVGMIVSPTTPALVLTAIALGVLGIAWLISLYPGARVARGHVATALRGRMSPYRAFAITERPMERRPS